MKKIVLLLNVAWLASCISKPPLIQNMNSDARGLMISSAQSTVRERLEQSHWLRARALVIEQLKYQANGIYVFFKSTGKNRSVKSYECALNYNDVSRMQVTDVGRNPGRFQIKLMSDAEKSVQVCRLGWDNEEDPIALTNALFSLFKNNGESSLP